MEYPFDIAACVGAPKDHSGPCVGYIDERVLRGAQGSKIGTVLEELGQRSATAQGLRRPVTFGSPHGLGDQRIYLLVEGHRALGFLKVGRKRLFVANAASHHASSGPLSRRAHADVSAVGAFTEIEPLCALDFYVHEKCQRTGHGRRLFDAMLARERCLPARLGYDRPSPKLLNFLKKHYGLTRYQPQNNNFVVYDDYFHAAAEAEEDDSRLRSSRQCLGSAGPGDSDPMGLRSNGSKERPPARGGGPLQSTAAGAASSSSRLRPSASSSAMPTSAAAGDAEMAGRSSSSRAGGGASQEAPLSRPSTSAAINNPWSSMAPAGASSDLSARRRHHHVGGTSNGAYGANCDAGDSPPPDLFGGPPWPHQAAGLSHHGNHRGCGRPQAAGYAGGMR
eukprot:TRINITY_DN41707_c0_g1_i1.p1 TRINITY_DN41707_c0_g1~~TRINITY_DN41707_c0_g1_i1.p1  ORF type:complete len:393 (+),score=60.98 TRINITY_DN41707_c0_g1_i1:115-1293(+)